MKFKRAFTVAEVLITMAVIAALASILLPQLLRVRPNQEMVMLKKAYYIAGRTVNELINDDEFYPEQSDEKVSGFSHTDDAVYHGVTYGPNGSGGASGKFCGLFAARMNVNGAVNCDAERDFEDGGNFTTSDGMIWRMPIGNFNSGSDTEQSRQNIEIDVNGTNRPNCFETGSGACENGQAPDRFRITIDRFGTITVPQDGIEQIYLSSNDTTMTYAELKALKGKTGTGTGTGTGQGGHGNLNPGTMQPMNPGTMQPVNPGLQQMNPGRATKF